MIFVQRRFGRYLLYTLGCLAISVPALSQTAAASPESGTKHVSERRDGQHDFDFNLGVWKTHVSRLLHPLTGSFESAEYDGISVVHGVWDGRASLFELEVDGPAGHIEGVGLRLYNPESHQWSLNWASSSDGVIQPPMIGEFKNGRGEFNGQELLNGRTILSRNRFSDITAESSCFEKAFS
ncbi:MAG: hypothetical protein WBW31_18415, partial [Candidatus Sulfotelmatobacter sp.]